MSPLEQLQSQNQIYEYDSQPELLSISQATDSLNQWTDRARDEMFATGADIATERILEAIEACGISPYLQEEGHTTEELNGLLRAVERADRVGGGDHVAWRYLGKVNARQLAELRDDPNSPVDTILGNAVHASDWKTYVDVLFVAQAAVVKQCGSMDTWRQAGKVLPSYIESSTKNKFFPLAYAEIRIKQLAEAGATKREEMTALRNAESTIVHEMLGITAESDFARNLILSLSERTMLLKDGRITPINQGGGIDTGKWQRVVDCLCRRVDALGADTLYRIYETCGIVDFDTLSVESLKTMRDFINGDERLIKQLQEKEARVVLKGSVRDYNNALGQVVGKFEGWGEGSTLFFGMRRPSDIYRPFALLKKHGIKPSSVVATLHGGVGAMNLNGIAIRATGQLSGGLSILDSSVDRIFRERMQPNKETGQREVILVSCLQANTGVSGNIMPTAEALASKSAVEDNVTVFAGVEPLNIRRAPDDAQKAEFYDPEINQPVKTIAYRRLPEKHPDGSPTHGPRVGKQVVPYVMEIK